MQLLQVLPFIGLVLAQQPKLDLTNKNDVVAAAKAAMWPLKMHYDANKEASGAWIEQLVQWHESGIYWNLFYQYMQYSGDTQYLSFVDHEMQISAGGNSDFLDGMNPFLEIAGRWNDDIGWWGLSTMTAAETFGKDAIVAKDNLLTGFNPKYFDLANNTYYEILIGSDDLCGGGIYWSRSRSSTSSDPYLKSTITNVEEMELGVRLYGMTKNPVYKNTVDTLYAWLKSSNIIGSDYTVYDGLRTTNCSVSYEVYSYHTGPLMTSLARMYVLTNDATYLTEAHNVFAAVKRQFVDPTTQTLSIEPLRPVGKDPSGYSFTVYRGLADLYLASNDDSIKSQIATILRASATANFKLCDSNWYCMRSMPVGTQFTLLNGTNVRDQFETVSILNSLSVMLGASSQISAVTTTKSAALGTASLSMAAVVGLLVGVVVPYLL
ncbi:Six-hairpin glycosidase [Rhizoclosmatium globosum]|uniref:Mannan endo-1,6-alpha-mannosidase n=1 Tax=Rhizoclosmatium globosum TaxID=329046 RepID=A0A1Y2B420_9FUNG|nr:Six-hairpin glycosidase [Rhizoclosmatium globosum]|eukprot:ORY29227.1 Six-hairpin glycosidase [Rhizoclosmatium globosum]